MIRIEALWLSAAPLDMRAGMDTLLAQVVRVFGEAQPHHAYLFSNRRGTRLKVLVHDGFGVWLACRRLNQGRFHWTEGQGGVALTRAQFDALVLGLPWQRLGDGGVVRHTTVKSLLQTVAHPYFLRISCGRNKSRSAECRLSCC
ncbi:IS66 family insertion sequence element accessory protein TnpB [Thauera sp. WB-2]|uniref:IS66 family insertion sequence element accessory protein TnpB n=1 Tax=Thauera sp. WB-2 TaxID=2897772 RepID=UPI0022DE2A4D|nr:IS66 family insertion sequence element accessory protein TnpB [Thauera sp. WB-2]WBL64726.1 IS66 family insertion sequence element accessory protein TnpB [Thauera sp. WB-2]